MGVTDADVTFINELPVPVGIKKTNSQAMGRDLPDSQTISPLSTSSTQRINTSDFSLDQSFFTLEYNGESVKVDLGTGLYKTDATWSATDGKIGGILAPINFLTPGVDFAFLFFAGAVGLTSYVNTYLLQNVQKFLNLLATHPVTITLPGSIQVIFRGMKIANLDCTYCSIGKPTDATGASKGLLSVTVILKTTLTASGSISLLGGSLISSGSLAITNATVLTRLTVDLSKPKLSVILTTLKTSVEDWKLSSNILDALTKAFPILAGILPELTNGYHLAACLNSDPTNGELIGLINTMLLELEGNGHTILASMIPLTDPTVVAEYSKSRPMAACAPGHVMLDPADLSEPQVSPQMNTSK